MKIQEKISYLQDKHFSEWLRTRQQIERELSSEQPMFCMCGKLATGLHERGCKRFNNKIINKTLKKLEHLIT